MILIVVLCAGIPRYEMQTSVIVCNPSVRNIPILVFQYVIVLKRTIVTLSDQKEPFVAVTSEVNRS